MTIQEWLSGLSILLDIGLLLILLWYMWCKRRQWGELHYCIAFALSIYITGAMLRQMWVWYELFTHPELKTIEELARAYPIVGSRFYTFGVVISVIGLLKLMYSFGRGYLGPWWWLAIIAGAILVPLFSIYF